MNGEERLYCASCSKPVEYLAEIDCYSCEGCEGVQLRDELISERDLLRADNFPVKAREVKHDDRD